MEKKIVLISGANRGIGLALVKKLLQLDYICILSCRDKKLKEELLTQLTPLGEIYFHPLDVTDQNSIDNIRDFIQDKFGRLDILVNNAGIFIDKKQKPSTLDLDLLRKTLDVNLFGAWALSQAFIPIMKKQQQGSIINVSSLAGAIHNLSLKAPAYGLSKMALNGFNIKLADELKEDHIQVNSVSPGWVKTEMGGQEAPLSVEEGTETIIWLIQQYPNGPTGKFYREKEETSY